MSVVVRFAPSPTGTLHIGGGRTALFNYYFAKHHGGKFLLRIEDTDRERSTPEAVQAIFNGLRWLGVDHDGDVTFQFERSARHADIARELIARGAAYYCYMTPQEIEAERAVCDAEGTQWHYDRRWRDTDPATTPKDVKPVVRLKAPVDDGALTLNDAVQGDVTVRHQQLDDMVLLRSDGTPTYMLAVVVDDHDMAVTHVIRGDDHLNNMFRQYLIYRGMGWDFPVHAHIPLIHGSDGKKLSKRRNSAAIEEYRDMGYLAEAMRNYLLRLGWSHGDDEIISDEQARAWFDLDHVGKSPPQLDIDKLNHISHHYIKIKDNNDLLSIIERMLQEKYGDYTHEQREALLRGFDGLKERSQTLLQLVDNARFYLLPLPLPMDDQAREKLAQPHAAQVLAAAMTVIDETEIWDGKAILAAILEKTGLKMGQVGPVLRAALTGTMQSPDLSELITALTGALTRQRISNVFTNKL